jgi:gamma-glutamyl:cysteine ligase YbdK (ATP-grasp superfamily)
VIPELVADRGEYEKRILAPIYEDLAPFDPAGVLRHEWANARGAIARFDRNTIEIRVIDVQECPLADLAVVAAIVAVVRALTLSDSTSPEAQRELTTEALAEVLLQTIRYADGALIEDPNYLDVLGVDTNREHLARDVWAELIERSGQHDLSEWSDVLETIVGEGCLARRILRRLGDHPTRDRIHSVYDELCNCLVAGETFHAES